MTRALVAATLALSLTGAAVLAMEASTDARVATFASLAALSFGIATTWGALLVLMTGLAARASWVAVFRRPLEALVAALPVLSIAMVALLVFARRLYPGLEGGPDLAPYEAHAVEHGARWHALGWLWARSAVYLAVPVALGEGLTALSRRLARAPSPTLDRLRSRVAAGGLVAMIALGSLAAFDWVMALEPAWVSTVYAAIWLASGYASALAALILAVAAVRLGGGLSALPAESVHRLGKLLLAATCIWAYFTFCQLLLIYLADLPAEVRYYLPRREGPWATLAAATAAGGFALPFLALLPRASKRRLAALAPIAAVVLLAHLLEHAWLVLPARPDVHVSPLASAGAFVAVLGALTLTSLLRARARAVGRLPTRDPLLPASLAEGT